MLRSLSTHCKSSRIKLGSWLLAALLLGANSVATGTEKYDILLDVSGSMQGFWVKNALWKSLLDPLQAQSRKNILFGNKNRYNLVVGSLLSSLKPTDTTTLLGEALDEWYRADGSPGQMLLLITDNVADTGNKTSLQSQQLFNTLLAGKDSPFTHVGVFALRLPFNGKVYRPGPGPGTLYTGKRALLLYLLGREGISDDDFRVSRQAMSQYIEKLSQIEQHYFQVRPFDPEELSSSLGGININAGHNNTVDVSIDGDKGLKIDNYSLGDPLQLNFRADIKSRASFELQDIELEAALTFDELPELSKASNFNADISPRRTTLTPNELKGFQISFDLGKNFDFFDLPLRKKLTYVAKNGAVLKGELEVLFHANRNSYQIARPLIDAWSYTGPVGTLNTPTEAIQGKVFNLDKIILDLLPNNVPEQTLKRIPVTLSMQFPLIPLFSVLFLLLLLGLLIFGLLKMSGGRNTYILESDYGDIDPVSVGFGQRYTKYDKDNQPLFSLRNMGLCFFLSSLLKQKRGSRCIGPGQSFVLLDAATEEEFGWRFYVRPKQSTGLDTGTDFD